MDDYVLQGLPLSSVGMDDMLIIHEDGTVEKLKGFGVAPGETIEQGVLRSLPKGAILVKDVWAV